MVATPAPLLMLAAGPSPLLLPAWAGSGKRRVLAERHIGHEVRPPSYTVGSLFTGIGGIDLAFVRAGFSIAWQVEIDPFCRKVLAKHAPQYWPNAEVYEDVRNVGRNNLKPVDVMVGGFPCQDISAAGKGRGIQEGTRSGLWIEFARLIGELRPRFVMLENVAAITYRDGTRVVADLAALGYGCEWGVIPASAVGAPHRRERWWCVAYATSVSNDGQHWNRSSEGQSVGSSVGAGLLSRVGGSRSSLGNTYSLSSEGQRAVWKQIAFARPEQTQLEGASNYSSIQWSTQSVMARAVNGLSRQLDSARFPARPSEPQHEWEAPRTATGISDRTARVKALSNAVVPQVVQPIAEAIYSVLKEQDHAAGQA